MVGLVGCTVASRNNQAALFQLTNQFGQPTRLEDLRGQTVVLTFLYTNCGDTCPLYLANVQEGLRGYRENANDRPVVVVVTVDPDRDSVGQLRRFASHWEPGWLFLTGAHKLVARTWADYGIDVIKRPPDGSDNVASGYTITHTTKVLVIDRTGLIRGVLTGWWTPEELSAMLRSAVVPASTTAKAVPAVDLTGLLRKCGEFAATHPVIFLSFVLLASLPVLVLTGYLFVSFVGPGRGLSDRH